MGKYGDYYAQQCNERKEPMVDVDPALRWHEHGCIKRYGVESDVMCRCERLRAERRDERTPGD